jgi:NTP pyrophosphatase (non-canonical NTP hydrolase)
MKWTDSLKIWRRDRNIVQPQGVYVASISEELEEYTDAVNASDEHEMIDALADIMVLTANEIALIGYDIDLVMKQVVKHISARQQDPVQKEEWLKSGPAGKWLKDKEQDPSTLVEPDYTVCRLSKASS